jgi:transposase
VGYSRLLALVVARGSKGLFPVRVREQIAGNPALIATIEPLLAVWYAIREQVTMLDRQMLARARNDHVARRLMTIPGVGVVIARAYAAVIDDPARFRRSVSVGAYLGLAPRRYQSGDVDTTGHISKCGGSLLRGYLYEAAAVLLHRDARASMLKSWGLGLAKRGGMRRAKVAVARKLAVIMHRIWSDHSEYRWTAIPPTAA